jgi:hypothetical protein
MGTQIDSIIMLYREWAVLIPAWSVVLFLTAYFVYIALGIYNTPDLSSMSALTGQLATVFDGRILCF